MVSSWQIRMKLRRETKISQITQIEELVRGFNRQAHSGFYLIAFLGVIHLDHG